MNRQKSESVKPGFIEAPLVGLSPLRARVRRRALLIFSLIVCQTALLACATEKYMFHSFSFRAFSESPDVDVMDYQYGAKSEYERQGYVGLRASKEEQERGNISGTGVSGVLPKGDYLYVKWRIKSTGQILEDKVDLTTRLPKDITQHEIHFLIKDTQLFVYLLPPPYKFSLLDYRKTDAVNVAYFKKHQIYPN